MTQERPEADARPAASGADADQPGADGRTGQPEHPATGEAAAGLCVVLRTVLRHDGYLTMIEVSRLSGSLSAFT